jgi:GNAT superfamily N-acetyltransferase
VNRVPWRRSHPVSGAASPHHRANGTAGWRNLNGRLNICAKSWCIILGNSALPWVKFRNFATLSSHQGRRIGTHLLQYLMDTARRLGFGIGAPPSRPGSLAAYTILKMSEAAPLRRQTLPLAIDALAASLVKPRWLTGPLAFVDNALLAGQRRTLCIWHNGGATDVAECESVDALLDQLFATALPATIGFDRCRAK